MSDLVSIPCVLMRGGTSKGPYFLASDLPRDLAYRDRVLLTAMGSGHPLEIDGIGGGHPVTSKVAIVGPSSRPDADVDYLFAQVKVEERIVDTSPNCGNMLAGVGPFAIEAGLIKATPEVTTLRIFNVNTNRVIEAKICTPGGVVSYEGDAAIDGVPGTAAPIHLAFIGAAGSKTGSLLPTGRPVDIVQGVEVSCVDAAMPVVLIRAADLGKTGLERPADYAADRAFMARLEAIRIEAGVMMGILDAADRVIPKPVLLAPAAAGGDLATRYFMPHQCHTALAITGSVAVATAAVTPGTLANGMVQPGALPVDLALEHPSGKLQVRLARRPDSPEPAAYILRTARRLFEGSVLVRRSDLQPAGSLRDAA
ncbi:4-oxalomesaconate tautomerase [Falsiroseomonas sp. HW251]|uniref:4-oxalomesaconate tautomerase n=1 Tax=Falsiroseomonas sp. HW251 TaxID=3390998 RepID=UPI003D31FA58